MRSLSKLAAVLMLFAAPACVGELDIGDPGESPNPDPDPDPGVSARALFDALQNDLRTECAACHEGPAAASLNSPAFMGLDANDPSDDYDAILGSVSELDGGPLIGDSPGNSRFWFYGEHTGPAFSTSTSAAVERWIIANAEENGITPPELPDVPDPDTPREPRTLIQALETFAGCMDYLDFQASNFQNVANQNSAEGQCYACHTQGTGGAFLAQSDLLMYTETKKMPYILKFVTGTVSSNGSFEDLIISGRYEMKRNDGGHPNYILAAARVASINQYYNDTYLKYRASIVSGVPCTPNLP
jgi:hypothetical protein